MEQADQQRYSKRDFLVLPLIGLLAILIPALAAETFARWYLVEADEDMCLMSDARGFRHKPGCTHRMKVAEGPWVDYRYNACGYRGADPCGPKPFGTTRIVVLGTSTAFGLHVPEDQLFTSRLGPELQRTLGHPVHFENLGMVGPGLREQYRLDEETLSLQPDGIILIVVPYDLNWMDAPQDDNGNREVGKGVVAKPFWQLGGGDLASLAKSSRAAVLAQHFILQDEYFAARALLLRSAPDETSRVPLSPLAQQRFTQFRSLILRMARDFKASQVPFTIVALPNRLQAIGINRHTKGPALDTLAFLHRVRDIAREAGAQFVDVVPDLQRATSVGTMFYAVDGHLNGQGHRVLAQSLLRSFQQQPTPHLTKLSSAGQNGN